MKAEDVSQFRGRSFELLDTAAIPGKWIVILKSGIDKRDVEQHLDWIHGTHRRSSSCRQTSGVERTFGIGDFHAYTGEFDEELLAEIQAKDEVIAIEPDHKASLTALTEVSDQPWGLASLSSRAKLASADVDHQTYKYDSSAGTGTFAYVLDSGIRISHPDFQGRAIKGTNVFPEVAHDDDFGHGTHVAGTIGSNITNTPARAGKSVVSMSLALNDAVDAATALGVFVVVGAGNDGKDASTRSPASAPTAFTVGAIDIDNTRATWSNFGPSVDVFAAGVDGPEGSFVDAPAAIGARIKELATKDMVADSGVGSPNLVTYNGNGRR
ncbi:alkaline proteinase [Colletotrichum tamarilloi]|uniref:Alkaline proteinase n=1 Tax=Colletotrichum tamarilloi TaxID=1209934 RepID=A0ABQ9QX67_9PEZI|nr:alkaline proteinase [Colletotrichum tamarilloi]KAK1488046.1 alkaline proteinase [Colletotrichum tamarilloi]